MVTTYINIKFDSHLTLRDFSVTAKCPFVNLGLKSIKWLEVCNLHRQLGQLSHHWHAYQMIASGIDILQIFKRIFHSVPKFFAIVDFIKCTVRRNFLQFQEYGPFQIRETMSIKLKCIQGGASSEDNLVSQVSQKFQFVSGLVCDID